MNKKPQDDNSKNVQGNFAGQNGSGGQNGHAERNDRAEQGANAEQNDLVEQEIAMMQRIEEFYAQKEHCFEEALNCLYSVRPVNSRLADAKIAAFSMISPPNRLYLCGYLTKDEYEEAIAVESAYYEGQLKYFEEKYDMAPTDAVIVKPIALKDVLARLKKPVPADLADEYFRRSERVSTACYLFALNALRQSQNDLSDGMTRFTLVDGEGRLKGAGDLLEYLILTRNALEIPDADADENLSVLTERFYQQSIDVLNEEVPGADKDVLNRSRLMAFYFSRLPRPFNSNKKDKPTAELMLETFPLFEKMLAAERFAWNETGADDEFIWVGSDAVPVFGVSAATLYNEHCVNAFKETVRPFKEFYEKQLSDLNKFKVCSSRKNPKGTPGHSNGNPGCSGGNGRT